MGGRREPQPKRQPPRHFPVAPSRASVPPCPPGAGGGEPGVQPRVFLLLSPWQFADVQQPDSSVAQEQAREQRGDREQRAAGREALGRTDCRCHASARPPPSPGSRNSPGGASAAATPTAAVAGEFARGAAAAAAAAASQESLLGL